MKPVTHSANGEPACKLGAVAIVKSSRRMVWRPVISRGKRIILSRPSLSPVLVELSDDGCKMVGGIVLYGLGDIRAKIRAAAVGSARVLNSAAGVTFPGP